MAILGSSEKVLQVSHSGRFKESDEMVSNFVEKTRKMFELCFNIEIDLWFMKIYRICNLGWITV